LVDIKGKTNKVNSYPDTSSLTMKNWGQGCAGCAG
jgi:hypothetical protein